MSFLYILLLIFFVVIFELSKVERKKKLIKVVTISSKSKKKTSNSKLSSDRIVISKNQMVDGIDLLKCGNIKVGDTKTTLMDSSVSIKPNGLNDIDFDVKKKDDVRRLVVYTEIFNRKWEY